MKRLMVFVWALAAGGAALWAEGSLDDASFVSGEWQADRLYQNDTGAHLARVNIRAPQRGEAAYDFNVKYEGGAEDGHGGFGLHIFVDTVPNKSAWGSGRSYLLWLNYDENPVSADIPRGLSVQVYRSLSHSRMTLVESVDLNGYLPLLLPALESPIPFKVRANGDTGEVRVYDPADSSGTGYFYFFMDKSVLPLKGEWVTLRTNGIAVSFGRGL